MKNLANILAQICHYAQSHIDDYDAWPKDKPARQDYLQCTSMTVACFLAQNTILGDEGVEWGIVIEKLVEPIRNIKEWEKIFNQLIKNLGGLNEPKTKKT